jgi:hypothetical protein
VPVLLRPDGRMSATVKLYERTEALAIIDQLLIETDGELTPEIEQLLAEAQLSFSEKAVSVAAKISELEATAEAIAAESQRLSIRSQRFAGQAESLRRYLLVQLQLAGAKKVEDARFTIAVRENPPKVVALLCEPEAITAAETMPAEELVACITHTPAVTTPARDSWDKKALLALWKSNPDLAGTVAQIERGVRLEVK